MSEVNIEKMVSIAQGLMAQHQLKTINKTLVKLVCDAMGLGEDIHAEQVKLILKQWQQSQKEAEPKNIAKKEATSTTATKAPKEAALAQDSRDQTPKAVQDANEATLEIVIDQKASSDKKTSVGQADAKNNPAKSHNPNNNGEKNHRNRNKNNKYRERVRDPLTQYDFYQTSNLEKMGDRELEAQIRKIEGALYKEQCRRESSEKQTQQVMQYADIVKEQVTHRINDLRSAMQDTITELKAQLKEEKGSHDKNLIAYHEQLESANKKIAAFLESKD